MSLVARWLAPSSSKRLEPGFILCNSVFLQRTYLYDYLTESAKGQIKPKADLCAEDSPKKQTNERICFVCFVAFHSKQNKFVNSVFGRIYGAPILLLVSSDL